jgi:hypothetical protein
MAGGTPPFGPLANSLYPECPAQEARATSSAGCVLAAEDRFLPAAEGMANQRHRDRNVDAGNPDADAAGGRQRERQLAKRLGKPRLLKYKS